MEEIWKKYDLQITQAKSDGLYLLALELMVKGMKEMKRFNADREFYFITVNPKESAELSTFLNCVEKFKRRKFVSNLIYAFEQRGDTVSNMGKGIHVHMVIDKPAKYSPAQIIDRLYSTFRSTLGSRASIDLKKYPYTWRDDKVEYLKGNKWDLSKIDACAVNALWRKKNNIRDIYYATEGETHHDYPETGEIQSDRETNYDYEEIGSQN